MGSNGIRFSISDLAPPTSRVLPTVYLGRVGISLYDAQFDPTTGARRPIPPAVIRAVIQSLRRFQTVCADFGVRDHHIRVLATEATRTARNSLEFRQDITHATGWAVEVLSKEEEGEVGAWGVASSFADVRGLVMDLGGGSMQITWMIAHQGDVRTSAKGAISFPYGAAAMARRLAEVERGKDEDEREKAVAKLREEMKTTFEKAYERLEIPDELIDAAKDEGGFPLYLSGGGFRGWGYLLLSQSQVHGHHYPISIINGFWAHKDDFANTDQLKEVARTAHKIFRVSDRRRQQVPAVAFLVHVLATALPHGIKDARFCQGGVRQGILFRDLPRRVRAVHPLPVATAPYAGPSAGAISALLRSALPASCTDDAATYPASISVPLVQALANVLFAHAALGKETASVCALYSTSTGILASAHGISHAHRAMLALMLEERFPGELPPRDAEVQVHLAELLHPAEVWWCRFIGTVAWLVAEVYPTGVIDARRPRMQFSSRWATRLGKQGTKKGVRLTVQVPATGDAMTHRATMEDEVQRIRKVGKRKNWIGGRQGWGMAVAVVVKVQEDLDAAVTRVSQTEDAR
ncbi:MAG: hypothetical protein M1838_004585 [Thelocarpon superellum]|nr:MAG: hypothetical protein M1838_004585 [Thelocarpon superellum]